MNLRTLLRITALMGVLFGAGFMVIPTMVWSLYGMTLNPGGIFQARMFGATCIGLALTILFTESLWTPALECAFAKAILAWTLVGGIVILTTQLQSVMNVLGWSYVALNLLFVVGYAYLLFIKRPRTRFTT